jgi:chromosome partitioning protein
MTIITVAQQKGGVGKTTLAISVAGELAHRGYDVALVDSDPQCSACEWASLGYLEFPVYEIGLDNIAIGNWAREVRRVKADIVLVDTAPGERQVGASIALADLVIVPCTPSGLDLDATGRTLSIITAVRRRRAAPLAVILIPNRVDSRTEEGRQLEDELLAMGETVSRPIGYRSAFVRAFNVGQSVAEFASGHAADNEIRALTDLILSNLSKPPKVPAV